MERVNVEEESDDGNSDSPEKSDVCARQVYVVMKKRTRVSRNLRACWFFRHLSNSVKFTPLTSLENLTEDLNLVSVVPKDEDQKLYHGKTYDVYIGEETNVTFLSSQYRLAFTLDLSPSLMSVDVHNGQYVFDGIFESLSRCLHGLVMPLPIPGSDISFSPDLYISVTIQTPVICSSTNQVLIQGVKVDQDNIDFYLKHIQSELRDFESALSVSFETLLAKHHRKESFFHQDDQEADENDSESLEELMGSPEAAFTNLLRYGILSLQLLPSNSSSGIVVITDGIVGLPSSDMMELLLGELRSHTIMCSFIKVGSPSGLYHKLAHVPHMELMRDIATATFGAFLSHGPDVSEEKGEANLYHRAMMFWSFQRGLEGFKYDLTHYADEDMAGSISWIKRMLYRHPLTGDLFGTEVDKRKALNRTVLARLGSVLSVRLREGYTIKSVTLLNDDKEILVKLQFPWRDDGRIEYAARASWPLDSSPNPSTQTEVYVEGNYELLHEIMCVKTSKTKSAYRINNIKNLCRIVESISTTDRMLEHLQSFSSNPLFYQVPEGIRHGMPLFTMQHDVPCLNTQLNSSSVTAFATFWKEVCKLDTNTWQKWMHSHRIGLVLEHDRQLPKYFQVPNASSRFASIGCRQALTSLSLFLHEWSTFALLESHSYIKFLYLDKVTDKDKDKAPNFFCMLRLTLKPPSMIIRLGFLGGTPASIRNEELNILRERMGSLCFPQCVGQKMVRKLHPGSAGKEEPLQNHKSPLNKEGSEIACCVLWEKPVDKILVVYESKPNDMTVVSEPIKENSYHHEQRAMWSVFRTVTHYLQHQRWVWNLQANSSIPIPMQAISRILSTITKSVDFVSGVLLTMIGNTRDRNKWRQIVRNIAVTNIYITGKYQFVKLLEAWNKVKYTKESYKLRLQEGFHVIVSSGGVTNLVLEVDMKDTTSNENGVDEDQQKCVIQYVIFPPHIKTIDSSVSEDEHEDTRIGEAEVTEYQVVTECWVEPQYGVCLNNPKEREYFDGLTYDKIAKAFYPLDYECVSSLSTFEHLVYLSENPIIPCPDATSAQSSPRSSPCHSLPHGKEESRRSKPTVNSIPFLFDLLSILPRSQQAEILFSTFIIGDGSESFQETALDPKEPNKLLFRLFFEKLKATHKNEILLSSEDSHRFATHILERPRKAETNPVPFTYRPDKCCDRESKHSSHTLGGAESQFTSFSSRRSTRSYGSTEPSPETAYAYHSKYTTSGHDRSSSSRYYRSNSSDHSPGSRNASNNASFGRSSRHSESSHCPKWRCFLKMDGSDQLFLTFVPARFDDLLLLNPIERCSSTDKETLRQMSSEPSPLAESRQEKQEVTKSPSVHSKSGANDSHRDNQERGPLPPLNLDARNEEVLEWVNTSTQAVKPAAKGAILLPVYVYNCQLKHITASLIDRWSFSLPEDIFEDKSYRPDTDLDLKSPRSSRGSLQSFRWTNEEEEDEREHWKNSMDRRSTDSNSVRIESFKEECSSLSEMFLTAFVYGVFQNLQNGFVLDTHDVDTAITRICEESHPLEVDMTTYLLSSCSHIQRLVSKARASLKNMEDAGCRGTKGDKIKRSQSVRFQDNPPDLRREEDWMKTPEILQLPATTVNLDDSFHQGIDSEHCKHRADSRLLNEAIRAKFDAAISQSFKPVTNLSEFYFFCPNVSPGELDTKDMMEESENAEVATENDDDTEDIVLTGKSELNENEESMDSNHSMSSSLDLHEDATYTTFVDKDPMPLFIQFTCTIKQRSNFQHTSVTRVPLCFGEITKELSDPLTSIDLSDFKVTLDINCLSLLEDEDFPLPARKPMLSRSVSLASQDHDDAEEKDSTVMSTAMAPIDIRYHLSKEQLLAINSLKEEIEWLMEEEIISALRNMHPINADVLMFVAEHIMSSSSQDQETSIYQNIDLQFVYGSDQSHHMFIEEFERQKLPGYRLTREGEFYFIIINKSEAHQLRYNQQIKSAVEQLDMIAEGTLDRQARVIMAEDRSLSMPCIFADDSDNPEIQILPASRSMTFSSVGNKTQQGIELLLVQEKPPEVEAGQSEVVKKDAPMETSLETQLLKTSHLPALYDETSPPREGSVLSGEASIKKSSSFAGLYGSQTRSPSSTTSFQNRSRHRSAPTVHTSQCSRPSTNPQTPSMISSRNSTTYDGFDGDVSDIEFDEMASISDISMNYQELPDFWLMVRTHVDKIEVFFHSRDAVFDGLPVNPRQKALFSTITNNIPNVCRKVNQILLLRDLNKTKRCNKLLVPEADEDLLPWSNRKTISGRSPSNDFHSGNTTSSYESYDDENEEGQSGYLAANMDLKPGFFACDVVLQHRFFMHPRLKTYEKRGSPPMGVLTLSRVLTKFSVTNRRNLFVIEELSSQNVFYVRLKEIQVLRECQDIDLDASLTDSTHFSQKSEGAPSRLEGDAISVSSLTHRYDDFVELIVHGIEEAGTEIKDDLMKMLQNRMDAALLNTVSLMLARNPQCKLKPSDISFIQRPHQEPTKTLRLTIPGHCSMYLVALLYYLHQNLLLFLHTPNYMDNNNPNCKFQDIYDGVWAPIPSRKVYIYNPTSGTGRGIACISVNLVDGQGREVKLLGCPPPARYSSSDITNPSDFNSMVHTTVHESTGSSRPGPTALIQFRIWECGNCSVESLCERLMATVRHALCDIITEYYVLTSPICWVPRNLLDSCTPSLPNSPVKVPAMTSVEKQHNPLSRKFSVDPPKSGNQNYRYLDFFAEPPTDQSSLPRTPVFATKGVNSNVSECTDFHHQTVAKYENGEEGNLHPLFGSLIEPWLNFCRATGVPSVTSAKFQVHAKFAIDFVLKELQQSIMTISPDTYLRAFKVIPASSTNNHPFGVIFTPSRKIAQGYHNLLERYSANGGKVKLMAIGRCIDQWRVMVPDRQDTQPSISTAMMKALRENQKFLPQDSIMSDLSSKVDMRSGEKSFVPRQRLMIITCEDKDLNLYLYNWGGDLPSKVEKIVTRLVQWNNARCHILDSIMGQKMGLFHHLAFSDLHYSITQNPYTQSSSEADSLIRNHAPPREYPPRRHSSLSSKEKDRVSHSFKRIIPFDQTFKNLHPPKLMERLFNNFTTDPVCRHGMQAQEFRMYNRQDKSQIPHAGPGCRKEGMEEKIPVCFLSDPVFQHGYQLNDMHKCLEQEEERNKLCHLYRGWSQGNWKAQVNHPVMEDYLVQLKRAGRLFHYCATPLVFSQKCRQNVVQKNVRKSPRVIGEPLAASGPTSSHNTGSVVNTAGNSAATTPATPDKSQRTRSRHGSGTSTVSSKGKGPSDLLEPGRKGSMSEMASTSSKSKCELEAEEPWHFALRQRFMGEYKGYLVTELGFIPLIVQPSLLVGHQNSGQHSQQSDTVNLQKTLAGGIILMELSFRQEYFCVNMYAIDCFQLHINVNQQMHLIFVDECDKYKDLIHVHSFAHDFHLCCVQSYLSKQETFTFPAAFDLDSFLSDFKLIFPYPPSFSRNCLKQDSISLRDLPFPGLTLYDFMLRQMASPDMSMFRMGDKFALVHLEHLSIANMSREVDEAASTPSESYLSSLIIINDCDKQSGLLERDSRTLHLKFFTVLTRQRDCYPIRTLEKAFGELICNQKKASNEEQEMSKSVAVKQHIGMRKEHINYRGYSNFQQHTLYKNLNAQSEKGKSKIGEMVQKSEMQCRRDFLWDRLLYSNLETDDRRNLNDTDDSEESVRIPLCYDEFGELLQNVTSIALSERDSQLDMLFNMPISWYLSLYTVLKLKYPDSHRCFTSPDGKTKYIVILNRNNLDMFAMMSVNELNGRIELCVVMKEPLAEEATHSPNTPNPTLYSFQTHMEDFVNVCCYHIWSSIL